MSVNIGKQRRYAGGGERHHPGVALVVGDGTIRIPLDGKTLPLLVLGAGRHTEELCEPSSVAPGGSA